MGAGPRRGLARLRTSFRCAFAGWADAWRSQPNLRIHILVAAGTAGLGLYLRLAAARWVALVLTYSLVLVAEFTNSALEALTDLASPSYHPQARRAKDLAAGGVLVAALGAVIVGLLVLGPPLWDRLAPLLP